MGRLFTDKNGAKRRLSGVPSADASFSADEMKDPDRLAKSLRALSNRLKALELATDAGYEETELTLTGTVIAPNTLAIAHSYGETVRWWISDWRGSVAYAYPQVIADPAATFNGVLGLKAYCTGTIIIRIVPSGAQVSV